LSNASSLSTRLIKPIQKPPNPNDRCHLHLIHLFIRGVNRIIRFAALATAEDNEIKLNTCDVPNVIDVSIVSLQHDNTNAPSICVQNINDFFAFKNTSVKHIGTNGFIRKSSSSVLIVRPPERYIFNAITQQLIATSACFHTFVLSILQDYCLEFSP
jgi:hypothetical protein